MQHRVFRQVSLGILFWQLVSVLVITAVLVLVPLTIFRDRPDVIGTLYMLAFSAGFSYLVLRLINQFPALKISNDKLEVTFLFFFWLSLPWDFITAATEIKLGGWGKALRIEFRPGIPLFYTLYGSFTHTFLDSGFLIFQAMDSYEEVVGIIKKKTSQG